jgi:pimeloyl-ACP methyl ester carboxylesterase
MLVELSDSPYPFTREDAKRMRMPVLLANGDKNAPVFLRIKEELAACLPRGESSTIRGASHAPHRQNPGLFDRSVLDFLEKH